MTSETTPLSAIEAYCLGKIVSECGEYAQVAGNALCFGIDTPDSGMLGRAKIEEELGDIHAAISFATLHGVVSGNAIARRSSRKLAKLLDPDQKDNLGRPLAPQPKNLHSAASLPIAVIEPDADAAADETIRVSTDVANALRNLTGEGASNVDALLRRLLKIDQSINVALDGPVGYQDSSTGLTLPEGFEIFRILDGRNYTAIAQGGEWVTTDGNRFANLNRLNVSLGKANPESAWLVWKFRDRDGQEHPLNSLRPLPKLRQRRRRTPKTED